MRNKITATVQLVTPQLAEAWLATTDKNRLLRPSRVEQYAADMKSGKWVLNGESIKFDTKGHLLNGQHRLHAVIASGMSVEMLVVHGLDRKTQTSMDTGISAKAWDWSDIPYARDICTMCNAIVLLRYPSISRAVTRSELEAVHLAVGAPVAQFIVKKMRSGIGSQAALRAAVALIHHAQGGTAKATLLTARAMEFIARMTTLAAPQDSPENALFRAYNIGTVVGRRGFAPHQRREMAGRAAYAAVVGEPAKLLRTFPDALRESLFSRTGLVFPASLAPKATGDKG